jgi:hypothetical protein
MRNFTLAFLSSFVCAVTLLAADKRDWTAHPAIVEIAAVPKDMYAVGDVQGDYDRLASLLLSAKLIVSMPAQPEAVEWKGGPAILVCTGNLINGHNQSLQVIALFRALQASAEKAGGKVIVTLGSSEAEFLASNGAKAGELAAELKAANLAAADVAVGTDAAGVGAWLRDLPIAAHIGDWFFCHAGSTENKKLAALSSELQKQIAASGYSAPILTNPKSLLLAKVVPHPWWEVDLASKLKSLESRIQQDENRIQRDKGKKNGSKDAAQAQQDEQKAKNDETETRKQMLGEKKLREDVAALNSHHLVFGHFAGKITFADNAYREAGTIATEFKGLVYFIDSGLSRTAENHGALLHVEGGHRATAELTDGKTTVLIP